jgi:Xaa-Pro aminopeptidase
MKDIDWLLITALDEVAWTLNLRGTDITFNPVFFSYLAFNPKS